MSQSRLAAASLAIVMVTLQVSAAVAQQVTLPHGNDLYMTPQYERRQPVAPIFEGWYQNPDGSYTLSFGFFNMNSEETLEIPLGPDNFIEPAQYDGNQPTTFPTSPTDYSLSIGRGFGVFAVHVPATFTPEDRVVWTLRSKGVTYSVPGKIGIEPYRLSAFNSPVGNGSMPPKVKFGANGEVGIGPEGVMSDQTLSTRVGTPVDVKVWAADNFEPSMREGVPIELRWYKYSGPVGGEVTFAYKAAASNPSAVDAGGRGGFGGGNRPSLRAPAEGGEASTTATFSAPGEYVLRVEAGNFGARDSSNSNQCCWTNGYVKVNVTP